MVEKLYDRHWSEMIEVESYEIRISIQMDSSISVQ